VHSIRRLERHQGNVRVAADNRACAVHHLHIGLQRRGWHYVAQRDRLSDAGDSGAHRQSERDPNRSRSRRIGNTVVVLDQRDLLHGER
jgi:hypothetical protein